MKRNATISASLLLVCCQCGLQYPVLWCDDISAIIECACFSIDGIRRLFVTPASTCSQHDRLITATRKLACE